MVEYEDEGLMTEGVLVKQRVSMNWDAAPTGDYGRRCSQVMDDDAVAVLRANSF